MCEEFAVPFCYRRCQKHFEALKLDRGLFLNLKRASKEQRALMLDDLDRTQKVRPSSWQYENEIGEAELMALAEKENAKCLTHRSKRL